MAWVLSEAWGQLGSRTSPMPRRYCSTSMWSTKCSGPVAVIEITPRYWRPRAGSDVTEPLAGTDHSGRPEVATPGGGGGGGGGGCVVGGRVVVVVFSGAVVVGISGVVVLVVWGMVEDGTW